MCVVQVPGAEAQLLSPELELKLKQGEQAEDCRGLGGEGAGSSGAHRGEEREEEEIQEGGAHRRPSTTQTKDRIGAGATAVVFKVQDAVSGETYAMKSPKSDQWRRVCSSPRGRAEVRRLSLIKHENLVGISGSCEDGSIKMEFIEGSSLLELLQHGPSPLSEAQVRTFTKQILLGLGALHRHGIVHQDIKPANILVDQWGTAKIADIPCCEEAGDEFAAQPQGRPAARAHSSQVLKPKGTPVFMAPETVRTGKANVKSDIWSLGCLVLNLLTGQLPWYEEDSSFSAMFKVGNGLKPSVPETLSEEAKAFLALCFDPNHETRCSADQLLSHVFLRPRSQIALEEPAAGAAESNQNMTLCELSAALEKDIRIRRSSSPSGRHRSGSLSPLAFSPSTRSPRGGSGGSGGSSPRDSFRIQQRLTFKALTTSACASTRARAIRKGLNLVNLRT